MKNVVFALIKAKSKWWNNVSSHFDMWYIEQLKTHWMRIEFARIMSRLGVFIVRALTHIRFLLTKQQNSIFSSGLNG